MAWAPASFLICSTRPRSRKQQQHTPHPTFHPERIIMQKTSKRKATPISNHDFDSDFTDLTSPVAVWIPAKDTFAPIPPEGLVQKKLIEFAFLNRMLGCQRKKE